MATYQFSTFVPRVSTFYFSEADNNGLNILDQADFRNQILPWQADVLYFQKWLMADDVTIMCHTLTNATTPRLYVCSRNVDADGLPTVIDSIDLLVAPYYKGTQTLAGNTYTNPDTGDTTVVDTSLWVFNFNNFSASITPNEIYYLRLDAFRGGSEVSYSYYSEPIYLRADKHPNTQLYQSMFLANKSANSNVIVSGWYDDYPTNTIPYVPTFTMRCESYVLPLDPKAVNVGYLQQLYQQLQITTQQVPMRTLKIGELCTGIPDYILQMVTEFLLADDVKIGGYSYILSGQNSQTAPADMWKSKRDENTPLLRAATVITPKKLTQQTMNRLVVSPCTCPKLINAAVTSDGVSYYGNFTFDMSGGEPCPFDIVVTAFTSFTFHITSLADFSSHDGDNYTKSFLIGGYPDLSYVIKLASDGRLCTSGSITYGCAGPVISSVEISPDGIGGYNSKIIYSSCGGTCHTMSWTYSQLSPATSDSGSFSNTVPCPPSGAFLHGLSPGGAINAGTTISYRLRGTDCCGNALTFDASYTIPCVGPTIPPGLTIVLISGVYYLRAVFANCGVDCHQANFGWVQNNIFNSGGNDSGVNNSNTISCVGPFPKTIDYPLNPNLDIVSVQPNIRYYISFTNCCGDTSPNNLVEYPKP